MKNVLLFCCSLLLSFCSQPLTAQRLKMDTLRVEQIYNDTAYQRYIPYLHGLFWTQQHDSLLRYYAQEADYIVLVDSIEDVINLQTPQGIFSFGKMTVNKSLKGHLKEGNVELLMKIAPQSKYYDYKTREYAGKDNSGTLYSHCNNWDWNERSISTSSIGKKIKQIYFAKDVSNEIPKAYKTTNKVLLKPIFSFGIIERGHIILTREMTNAPKIIFIPQRNISIEATLKCTQEARRIFTTEQDLYTYLGTLNSCISIKDFSVQKKSPVLNAGNRGLPPEIQEITPLSITAGTNSILTITGANFGNTKGQIIFPNGNSLLFGSVPIPESHILSWSNDEILVKIPSSFELGNGTPAIPYSGIFTLITNTGETVDILEIRYAVKTEQEDLVSAYRRRYALPINCHTFNVRVQKALIDKYPTVKTCIAASLDKWKAETGMQWQFAPDIDATYDVIEALDDDFSYIFLYPYNDPNNEKLMSTIVKYACDEDEIFTHKFFIRVATEIDFYLDCSEQIVPPSAAYGKHDFYRTFLHEVGHANLLHHAVGYNFDLYALDNSKNIMRSGSQGILSSSMNREIHLLEYDIDGAQDVGSFSAAATIPATCSVLADISIKDCPADNGSEPNLACDPNPDYIWESPDIWACKGSDPCSENTLAGIAEQSDHTIKVRLHNIGCADAPAAFGNLELYWTLQRSGETWNKHWINSLSNQQSGHPLGGQIGAQSTASISEGGSAIHNFLWQSADIPVYSNYTFALNNIPSDIF